MITAILWRPQTGATAPILRALPAEVMVLRPETEAEAEELLLSLPLDLVITEISNLSESETALLERLWDPALGLVTVIAAPGWVIEEVTATGARGPAIWVDPALGEAEAARRVEHALDRVRLERAAKSPPAHEAGVSIAQAESGAGRTLAETAFHKLMGALAAGFDLRRLLDAYTSAITELTSCGSYCLLWREPGEDLYKVARATGMHRALARHGRLRGMDALPTWYRRQRRVITRAELAARAGDDAACAEMLREATIFGGSVIVPILDGARLDGLLMLGEKVAGGSYSAAEVETLFLLSTQTAIAARDIELHQELSRSKDYMDKVLSNINGGVVVLGRDHKVLIYNRHAQQTLGVPVERVLNQDLRSLPAPLGDYAYAALAVGETLRERQVKLPGTQRTLSVSTAQLNDEQGRAIGGLLFFDDITDRLRLAEQEAQAQRLELLGKIAARLAHQIRTPLSSIRTFAELFPLNGDQEELKQFWATTVLQEVNRLSAMVSQMLTLVEASEATPRPVSPQELLDQVLSRLDQTDEGAWCKTEVRGLGSAPHVLVEPGSVSDALLYLLQFARGESRNWVEISVGEASGNGDRGKLEVTLTVRNWVPECELLERLLDPVYVLQNMDAEIGPAVSQRILQGQGGEVRVETVEGSTRIKALLPLAGAAEGGATEVRER